MKALLIAECEGFIKNKRYISYILFLLLCGINGVFAIKSLNPQDKFPTILFMIFSLMTSKKEILSIRKVLDYYPLNNNLL